jgi:protein-S-isoprenylcysteine O-methyltransferase Ste14
MLRAIAKLAYLTSPLAMNRTLVTLQFMLIALLMWPPNLSMLSELSVLSLRVATALLGFVCGLALFAWSYASMPRESFTIMPEPRDGNQLCERGPYRYVRHPMYTSVLICALAAAYGYGHPAKWLAVLALCVVLWVKLKREEHYLLQKHGSNYAHYMQRTKALVPFVG